MNSQKLFGGISGSTLKLFAIITMLIDHTGATVIRAILQHPDITYDAALKATWQSIYSMSRSIGRFAFPVFCFLLVEGFLHTRNVYKYAGRMFLFALISEIPFDIALKSGWYDPSKQNVYFTLLIGLLVLIGISWCECLCQLHTAVFGICKHSTDPEIPAAPSDSASPDSCIALYKSCVQKLPVILRQVICLLLSFAVLYAGMEVATYIDTDYNFKGVFLIALLYLTRSSRLLQCMSGAAGVAWELPAPLGFLPVYLYNGSRGLRLKYLFYWFYPVHLLILHGLSDYVIPLL